MRVRTQSGAAAHDKKTANNFNVLKFTGETTHAANVIPETWVGQEVEIYVSGGDLHYGFSTHSDAEIDRSVSATAAGASAKVGAVLPDGNYDQVVLPDSPSPVYFVREATASVTVFIRLIDGLNTARGG